jgi:glucose/arabinose dehydrogenase
MAAPALLGGMTAQAQDATAVPGPPPMPENCTVVASELYNPRKVAIAEDGTLYVTEAGDGGDEAIYAPAGDGTPAPAEVLSMRGLTSQVTMVTPDGTQSVLATGLPSYTFGSEIVGASGIAVSNGMVYVAVGGPGPATGLIDPLVNQDSVVAIDPATGMMTTVADIGSFERSTNPDPNAIDSNLYGIAAGPDGTLYVADAGGNAVYTVNAETGEFSVLAVIPGIPAPGGPANPARGGAQEIDPVPTGLVVGADGTVYVSLLSGGPFIPGTAKIQAIAADGTVSDAGAGLTMLGDIAMAADGSFYVSQISDNLLEGALGSVVHVNADGTSEPVLSGLVTPNGLAVGPDGSLYVVVNSTVPGGTPASGMVLRCDVAAGMDAAATPESAGLTVQLAEFAYSPKASR